MRRRGRDLRVAPRGGQSQKRQRRIVVAVNQVVSDSGMPRLARQNAVQNPSGLLFVGVALVARRHPLRDERQRVEDAGLTIRWIAAIKPLHRFAVSERARPMIQLVRVLVKNLYRRDVIPLAFSPRAGGLGLFHGAQPLLQLRHARRRPDGMVVAHCYAPVSHAALRVSDRDFGECLFSLFILERMEPGDRAIELPPGLGSAGYGEFDSSQLFRGVMRVLMRFLRSGKGSVAEKSRENGGGYRRNDQKGAFHKFSSFRWISTASGSERGYGSVPRAVASAAMDQYRER